MSDRSAVAAFAFVSLLVSAAWSPHPHAGSPIDLRLSGQRVAAVTAAEVQRPERLRWQASTSGTTFFVDSTLGADTNAGTAAAPFKTISKGLSVSHSGDVVNVASGTYSRRSGETFPITMAGGVSLIGAGAASTIVDASGVDATSGGPSRVLQSTGNPAGTLIEGFTITGGYAFPAVGPAFGGGIAFLDGDLTTLSRCIITNNEARGVWGNSTYTGDGGDAYGGGIYSAGSPVIVNCVISNNRARGGDAGTWGTGFHGGTGQGGGLLLGGSPTLINNTIVGNLAVGGGWGSKGLAGEGHGGAASGGVHINTIFANNIAQGGVGENAFATGAAVAGGLEGGDADHCLFFNNDPAVGETVGSNAVMADPLFAGPGDYHLQPSSPARGAGTAQGAPTIDLETAPRPTPPAIGAYESSRAATTTTLQSTNNPALPGSAVTFTATVSSETAGTISGNVTFKDADVMLGTVPLSAGTASVTISSLSIGSHAITATYIGDAMYAVSSTPLLLETVKPAPGPRSGITWYVSATTGSDSNDGSPAAPFRTIGKALSTATSGDNVSVAAGRYGPGIGEVLPLVMPDGVALTGEGAYTTIIDATPTRPYGATSVYGRIFNCIGNGSDTIISGFTITGGSASPYGGAIFFGAGDLTTVTRCIISTNRALGPDGDSSHHDGFPAFGGAIYSLDSSPTITNCVIDHNHAQGGRPWYGTGGTADGGGLYISGGAPTLVNNTVVVNAASGGSANATGERPGSARDGGAFGGIHVNTIFANNAAIGGGPGANDFATPGPAYSGGLGGALATNNLLYNNTPTQDETVGTNAVRADPQFLGVGEAPFRIHSTSIAAGAGTPVGAPPIDLDGRPRPSPPAIGAYEPTGDNATTTALQSSLNPSNVGDTVTFTASVTSSHAGTITGTVTFSDGGNALGASTVSGGSAVFSTSSLTRGSHSITASYAGDSTYAASVSPALSQTVNGPLGTPGQFSATATKTTSVDLSWSAVSGATYEIYRDGALLTTTGTTSFSDSSVAERTTYLYKVRAVDAFGVSSFTNSDPATTIIFTDDPVMAGETSCKLAHINELRQAVQAMRAAAGLEPATFTDPSLDVGDVVRAVHVVELRSALDEARAALELPAMIWTDSPVQSGVTAVKAIHINELRNGVK